MSSIKGTDEQGQIERKGLEFAEEVREEGKEKEWDVRLHSFTLKICKSWGQEEAIR